MFTGPSRKMPFAPAEESWGSGEILFVSIFKAPNGFLFWRMPVRNSLCWSAVPSELAVLWLCGATSQLWPGPSALESDFTLGHGFLALSYHSNGGPASRETLCRERAAIPGVHPGRAHGTRELRIQ